MLRAGTGRWLLSCLLQLGGLVGNEAASLCLPWQHPLVDPCPPALAREDHPDLIQSAKKSDIPEKPKTPQQLWYTHEKKVYLKVRPDVSVRPEEQGRRAHVARRGGAAPGRLGTVQGSRRGGPSPGVGCMDRAWASWRASVCVRVCEPAPLAPRRDAPACPPSPPGLWGTLV